jgi:hypothetical protein
MAIFKLLQGRHGVAVGFVAPGDVFTVDDANLSELAQLRAQPGRYQELRATAEQSPPAPPPRPPGPTSHSR